MKGHYFEPCVNCGSCVICSQGACKDHRAETAHPAPPEPEPDDKEAA